MDNIFKKGDRVFNITLGWVNVTDKTQIKNDNLGIMIPVTKEEWNDFVYMPEKELSFTEYTLNGFSQERPINYDEWVGKWCKFWDTDSSALFIRRLSDVNKHKVFRCHLGHGWDNCEPLSEIAIKELGL